MRGGGLKFGGQWKLLELADWRTLYPNSCKLQAPAKGAFLVPPVPFFPEESVSPAPRCGQG